MHSWEPFEVEFRIVRPDGEVRWIGEPPAGVPTEGLATDALAATVERRPDLELLRGKCVVEIRRAGVDKGRAIAALMASEPFRGRLPIFAGDDVTDEAGFAVVQQAGGVAIKVGDGASLAQHACESPEALRGWLASAASGAMATR